MPVRRVPASLLGTVGLLLALAVAACAPQASPQPAPTTPVSAVAPTAASLPKTALSTTVPANTLPTSTPVTSATRGATPAATSQSAASSAAAATSALPGAAAVTPSATGAAGGPTGGQVALLLPGTNATRYEMADRPAFEQRLAKLCPDVTVIYSNANQDADAQMTQAEAAIRNGAGVLVLDPVDSAAAGAIATKAKAQGIPVIAYDRLILNSDGVNFYVSFDNHLVGELQARSLVSKLTQLGTQTPQLVMINGAPTDNNAQMFKAGAHSVFDRLVAAGTLKIAKEYDTPDWSADQAQNEMTQAITALGGNIDGVYAANDATASGAIAAMKTAKMNSLPPVTGQDAELAAVQRLLKGEQYMTVYKPIQPEAETAAQLACDLVKKRTINTPLMTNDRTINNGAMDVPALLLPPIAVTRDNIKNTVIQGGFWTAEQICTPDVADACKQAGIQ